MYRKRHAKREGPSLSTPQHPSEEALNAWLQRLQSGDRLAPEEAIQLVEQAPLPALGLAAQQRTEQQNPAGRVGFLLDQTIVYSNVCDPDCPFCAGTVTRDDPRAFTLTPEEVVAKAAPAVAAGAQQIILQGGHRTDLPWDYYLGLLRALKRAYPGVAVAAYSPSEIMVFRTWLQQETRQVMADLQQAGLDLLLSGGAEALGRIRRPEYRVLLRGPWNQWFDVLHRAHDLQIPVVGMIPFGVRETARERVGLLYRMRSVQDRTGSNGRPVFRALVPFFGGAEPTLGTALPEGIVWPQSGPELGAEGKNPVLNRGTERELRRESGVESGTGGPTGYEYLRMVALSRLLVDNVPRLQVSFLTEGAKVAQVALGGGADDFGGLQYQYEGVELAAGRVGRMTQDEVARLIRDAGCTPVRRTPFFEELEILEMQ